MHIVHIHIAAVKEGEQVFWGAVMRLVDNDKSRMINREMIRGDVPGEQTVHRGEITAAIQALHRVQLTPIILYTTNRAIIRTMGKNKAPGDLNLDLWRELLMLSMTRDIQKTVYTKSKQFRLEAFRVARGEPLTSENRKGET